LWSKYKIYINTEIDFKLLLLLKSYWDNQFFPVLNNFFYFKTFRNNWQNFYDPSILYITNWKLFIYLNKVNSMLPWVHKWSTVVYIILEVDYAHFYVDEYHLLISLYHRFLCWWCNIIVENVILQYRKTIV